MSTLTYSWFMDARTLHAPLDALSAADRPQGIEIATLTTFDIPALAALTLEAYDDAVTPDGPFVVDLIVAPDYRRRGIATALISEVASRCTNWGFDSLALRLDRRHGGARELYSVLGFEEIA